MTNARVDLCQRGTWHYILYRIAPFNLELTLFIQTILIASLGPSA